LDSTLVDWVSANVLQFAERDEFIRSAFASELPGRRGAGSVGGVANVNARAAAACSRRRRAAVYAHRCAVRGALAMGGASAFAT